MSNDPIGYGDGLNMYAYVGNDPVNYRDPLGLDDEPIEEITSTGSGSACNAACKKALADAAKTFFETLNQHYGQGLGYVLIAGVGDAWVSGNTSSTASESTADYGEEIVVTGKRSSSLSNCTPTSSFGGSFDDVISVSIDKGRALTGGTTQGQLLKAGRTAIAQFLGTAQGGHALAGMRSGALNNLDVRLNTQGVNNWPIGSNIINFDPINPVFVVTTEHLLNFFGAGKTATPAAVVFGHETGHALHGIWDTEDGKQNSNKGDRMHNVITVENSVRYDLCLDPRLAY